MGRTSPSGREPSESSKKLRCGEASTELKMYCSCGQADKQAGIILDDDRTSSVTSPNMESSGKINPGTIEWRRRCRPCLGKKSHLLLEWSGICTLADSTVAADLLNKVA